ncbi:Ras association domain-containing protein 9 [Oryzias melastigma]|uniref:Ras association domain family member 9 n=1 Tax=Oryzias melastigma TaxID=30732 RepID=A0A3B3B9R4_ORYME|nr:ras association domain-containing protein 9 [Oryzias melastigma]KAF6721570.1 Ras association domain-containing protein 9 [Oryzias melastigma]
MAPFGKNFLKARMKTRTKDPEPVVGKEIQVTVCNEEKVVCGVTKHTTCADMIQALLEDHKSVPESKRLLQGEPKDFCLVERWKGFERALPPLTRILRLWYAWGDQRPFIQFILVKTSDFVPQPAKKGLKPKGAKPKRWEYGRTQYAQSLPAEKQKRMVKKAFRKLEKLHKENRGFPGTEEIDRMVQLILHQDHTIREQFQRMRELDLEIERIELQGQKEADSDSSVSQTSGPNSSAQREEQLQEFLLTSDGVQKLELQVERHRELILLLSQDIDSELRKADLLLVQDRDGEPTGAAAASQLPPEAGNELYFSELDRLKDELQDSIINGVSLHNQTAEIEKQLMYFDSALMAKDQECWQLATQLNSLQITDCVEEKQPVCILLNSEAQCSLMSHTMKVKQSLLPLDVTDTDSDTGISSTHSQDSLSPCLDFPPPLDTDV